MIEFGLSRLRAYTNGLGSGCAIGTGGAGSTATVATGYVYIGGRTITVSATELDMSALGQPSGTYYLFAYLGTGQSSTATLDATSVAPDKQGGANAILGKFTHASGSTTNIDISGSSGLQEIGRAMNCTVNITYDSSVARGGTMIFPNAAKLYNGNIEGTLEYAEINGEQFAKVFGGAWASGGVGCGTWTLTGSDEPLNFMIETQQITKGVTATIQIMKCYSPGLTLNIDRENWTQPSLNFQAIANSEGEVIKVIST